jgi:putative transposase
MARLPRFNLPGHPQHVIVRGNNREPIFYADDDYRFYLEKLKQACDKHQCDVHAYVLMTNHVHFLITPHTGNGLSKAIQMIGRYYVQYFNHTYQRTGTLWEGRYKATLIDSETYALSCYRYIELNPVRARDMVDHPSKYPWSSYRHNAMGKYNELIVHHELYQGLGQNDEERRKAYRALFRTQISKRILDEIRETTNKAWVLGSEHFKDRINAQLNRPASPRPRGGDRKSDGYRKQSNINRV